MEYRKLPQCVGCGLYNAPGPVFGEGDPQTAKFVYISQTPMTGGVESIFNRQLAEAGIARDAIYVTPQVKCSPGKRDPTLSEVAHCSQFLKAELERCKADTVVVSGGMAWDANIGHLSSLSKRYLPTNAISQRMGCVEELKGRKWIGTISPGSIFANPEYKEAGVIHLKKAYEISGTKMPSLQIRTHVTDEEVLEVVDKIVLGGEFSDDVETVGLDNVEEDDYVGGDWLVTMLGLAYSPTEAVVLDPKQIQLTQPIFTQPHVWRYEHNGEFDNYFIERYVPAQIMANRKFDTMQATHWLRSHAPKKLKPYVLSTYTKLPYYNRDLGEVDERLYNGMDVLATFQAAQSQKRELRGAGLEEVFHHLGMGILPVLEEWRRVGLKVDTRKAALFKLIIEEKITRARGLIAKIAGEDFNPDAPRQVLTLLYSTFGLPKQTKESRKKNADGEWNTESRTTADFEARKRLRLWIGETDERQEKYKDAYLFLNLLDFLNGEDKKLEYISRISPDSRIHPNYKAHGQRTFRLGSTPSVVNIPVHDISSWGGARRDSSDEESPIEESYEDTEDAEPSERLGSLRSLVIPDQPQDWILSCDYEQMQLWILAARFKIKWLLDIFESGEYIYGTFYEQLYKEPFFQEGKPRTKTYMLPSVSKSKLRMAKTVPLGFVFNRSGEAVAKQYGLTKEEGRKYRTDFMNNCEGLEAAYAKVVYEIKQKGKYRYAYGQLMHFPDLNTNVGINGCAQSEEAMIVRESIILINAEFASRDWKPRTRTMLSVHDAITCNINGDLPPTHLCEVYEEVIAPVLNRPIPQLGGFCFRHTCEISKSWDWEEVKYSEWKKRYVS